MKRSNRFQSIGCITLLIISFISIPSYAELISMHTNALGIKLTKYEVQKDIYMYACPNIIHINEHDAAGAVAQLKLAGSNSDEIRYNFYLKNLTKLVEFERFGDLSIIPKALDFIDEYYSKTKWVDYANKSIKASTVIKDFQPELESDFYRFMRKNWYRWSDKANLRWVKKRLNTMVTRLDELDKTFGRLGKILTINEEIIKFLLATEFDKGLMLERLAIIEQKFKISDPQFDNAINTLRETLEGDMDSIYDKLISAAQIRALDGSFDELFSSVFKEGATIYIGKELAIFLKNKGLSLGKTTILSVLVMEGIGELWNEFVAAPKEIIDHFVLGTFLRSHADITSDHDFDFLEDPSCSSYEEYLNAQTKAYLLYLFFENIKTITENTGITDSWVKYLNVMHYAELIAYGEEKIDRDHIVKEVDAILAIIDRNFDLITYANTLPSCNNLFPDITKEVWFCPYVEKLHFAGIVNGNPEGYYLPEHNINRAEFVKMTLEAAYQYTDFTAPAAEAPFIDVPKEEWFAPYVLFAKEKGIVRGYEDGTFRPGENINRAEAVKILINSFNIPLNYDVGEKVESEVFYDVHDVGDWFYPYVYTGKDRSIIEGYKDGYNCEMSYDGHKYFCPGKPINRAEAAKIVCVAKYGLEDCNNFPCCEQ
ncbi:MAG: S-layer homology domain-containing protein [Candidatus Electrothrix sp. YB6]